MDLRIRLTPEERKKLLKKKEIVSLVAEETGYLEYEVEDILNSFVMKIADALSENRPVRIEHIVTLIPRMTVKRSFKSGLTGEIHTTVPKWTVKPIVNDYLKARANNEETAYTED